MAAGVTVRSRSPFPPLVRLALACAFVAQAPSARAADSGSQARADDGEPGLARVNVLGLPRKVSLGSQSCRAPCVLRVEPGMHSIDAEGVPSRRVHLDATEYRLDVGVSRTPFFLGVALVGAALVLVPTGFVVQAAGDPCASQGPACTEPSTVVWVVAGGLAVIGVLPLAVGSFEVASGVRARLFSGDEYLSGAAHPRVEISPWAAPSRDGRGAVSGLRVTF